MEQHFKQQMVSIVLPVCNEENNLEELNLRLRSTLDRFNEYVFEYIYINDGSTDKSSAILANLQTKYSDISIINFSRNFGHQAAITAGLVQSKGDAVIVMDTDLQDPPEACAELIYQWQKGFKVVNAKRRSREDGLFKKFSALVFYRLLNRLSDIPIEEDVGDFRLLSNEVVSEFLRLKERNRFVRGMISYIGFKQTSILIDRNERKSGYTKYPFRKMLKLSVDAITGFSTIPLKIISEFGLLVAFFSLTGIIYAVYMRFFHPELTVPGWTTLVLSVLFIGGIQIIILGIIGSYIGRIYNEVLRRPLYIIESISAPKKNSTQEYEKKI